jgi:hypothetical protein
MIKLETGDFVTSPELLTRIDEAMRRVEAMAPEEKREMYRKQRESWVRAFQPCEHGIYDFEQCGDCRGDAA